MGRSVETIGDNIVYFDFSYDDIDFATENWQDLQNNIICAITARYKSFVNTPNQWARWPYRENCILLENDHIQISISEYCGCGAVSVFVRGDTEYPELAEHWLNQVWTTLSKLIGKYVIVINRIGTFSNGCAIFNRK
ncbi:hypothetical protein LCGC14_0598210 [marine sediment metagenome]|uniref:Uncharacterized protein n=1 Tax=marine sediment metagenome TaxID=412755 RepID=A0A0F9RV72_9ZZZZ